MKLAKEPNAGKSSEQVDFSIPHPLTVFHPDPVHRNTLKNCSHTGGQTNHLNSPSLLCSTLGFSPSNKVRWIIHQLILKVRWIIHQLILKVFLPFFFCCNAWTTAQVMPALSVLAKVEICNSMLVA